MAQVSYRSQERRARELLPWGLLSFVSLARLQQVEVIYGRGSAL